MKRANAENGSRHGRALVSCALAIVWLMVLAVGALAIGGAPTAQAHSAVNAAPTDTPTPGGPPFPTRTPRETVTATAEATSTDVPTRAPTQTSFTPGPQPTRVNFSQPTVGASARFDSPGITGAPGGPNGLVIATITGCITGLIALITTAIAFTVLRRGGYAPFLRLLLLGNRAALRGRSRVRATRGQGNTRRASGAARGGGDRNYARGGSGRYRDDAW